MINGDTTLYTPPDPVSRVEKRLAGLGSFGVGVRIFILAETRRLGLSYLSQRGSACPHSSAVELSSALWRLPTKNLNPLQGSNKKKYRKK